MCLFDRLYFKPISIVRDGLNRQGCKDNIRLRISTTKINDSIDCHEENFFLQISFAEIFSDSILRKELFALFTALFSGRLLSSLIEFF